MNKTKVVVIGSGNNAEQFLRGNKENDYIEIVGSIPDAGLNAENKSKHEDLIKQADMGFTLGYSKIIPPEICDKYFIINLHAGILPKWRGFSANAWAIMNGENEIGYSLHRVTSDLDGGLLYFVKHIPIDIKQTVSDVHGEMLDSIAKDCPQKLHEIFNGQIEGQKQSDNDIAYCTRFNAQMGILEDFHKTADYYVNLYRCMAEPLGSGISFYYKGEKYHVGKIEHGKEHDSADYLCQEGKIVNVQNSRIWIKVKDNVIVLSNLTKDGMDVNPIKCFTNGMYVGGRENA